LYSDAAIHGRRFLQIGFNRHSSYDHQLNSTRGGRAVPCSMLKMAAKPHYLASPAVRPIDLFEASPLSAKVRRGKIDIR
jgi:hypothetical protein